MGLGWPSCFSKISLRFRMGWVSLVRIVVALAAVTQLMSLDAGSVRRFRSWLVDNGAALGSADVADTRFGLGLRATEAVNPGSIVASIPRELAMDYSTATMNPVIGQLVRRAYAASNAKNRMLQQDAEARLLAVGMLLHYEYFYVLRSESFWGPWLDMLPGPGDDCRSSASALPRCWTLKENEMAKVAAFGPDVDPGDLQSESRFASRLALLHRDLIWNHLPMIYGDASDQVVYARLLSELNWVLSVVHSRAFGPSATGGWAAMLPLIDLSNHNMDAGSAVQALNDTLLSSRAVSHGGISAELHPSRFAVVTYTGIQAGDEVLIRYRDSSNLQSLCSASLLLTYGFVDTALRSDCLKVRFSLEPTDKTKSLSVQRRTALVNCGMLSSEQAEFNLVALFQRGLPLSDRAVCYHQLMSLTVRDFSGLVIVKTECPCLGDKLGLSTRRRSLLRLRHVLRRSVLETTAEIARWMRGRDVPSVPPALLYSTPFRAGDESQMIHPTAVECAKTIKAAVADDLKRGRDPARDFTHELQAASCWLVAHSGELVDLSAISPQSTGALRNTSVAINVTSLPVSVDLPASETGSDPTGTLHGRSFRGELLHFAGAMSQSRRAILHVHAGATRAALWSLALIQSQLQQLDPAVPVR